MLNDEQVRRLLDIANAGCHMGHIDEARTVYDGILADRPNYAPALIGKALSFIAVGQFEEAETILKAILEANSDDSEARAMLGLCYVLSERKDEAIELLEPIANEDTPTSKFASDLLEQARG